MNFTKIVPQIFDMDVKFDIDFGNNLIAHHKLYLVTRDKRKTLLRETRNNKGPCLWMIKYFQEIWTLLQKHMGLTPGACPMPKVIIKIV